MVTIFIAVFVPFIVYAMACIFYFTIHSVRITQNSQIEEDFEYEGWAEYIAKLLVYSLTFFMFTFEIFQMMDKGWNYIKSV